MKTALYIGKGRNKATDQTHEILSLFTLILCATVALWVLASILWRTP